jgi:SpoVK/Ycf46/Vps4 family AAA+-type ATPase
VFVAATCNAIETLPPEMIRKGRFDEIFFIDLPAREQREDILAIHLRKRKRDPARYDLKSLATAAEGFSGAELEQAVVSALYNALSGGEELTTSGLLAETREMRPPSVTRREDVAALRERAKGRTVPAGSGGTS